MKKKKKKKYVYLTYYVVIQIQQCKLLINVGRPDTPQFRGGNPYFFSENPYPSVSFIYASMYRENVHAIHITMQFLQKNRDIV